MAYASGGAIVVAFEVLSWGPSPAEGKTYLACVRDFLRREGGLLPGRAALYAALATLPVDEERVAVVGRGPGATLALQLAQRERRVKACVAMAPIVDFDAYFADRAGTMIREGLPSFAPYYEAYSPSRRIADLRAPLLLMHVKEGEPAHVKRIERFRDELLRLERPVTGMRVRKRSHAQPLVREGVPRAVKWLQELWK